MEKNGGNGSGYWSALSEAASLTEKETDDLFLVNNLLRVVLPKRNLFEEIQKMAHSDRYTECEVKSLLRGALYERFQKDEELKKTLSYIVYLYLKAFREMEQLSESESVQIFTGRAENCLLAEESKSFRSKQTLFKGDCVGGFFPH
ncbi:MAG: hypothetical protein ACOX6C_01180 [Patescibacteria group bacterium]|jgi:hypothetical protein